MITICLILTLFFSFISLIAKFLLKATLFSGKIIVAVLKFFAKAFFVFIIAAIILGILFFIL